MQSFMETLVSEGGGADLPEECDYFGSLIGSWELDYVNHATSTTIKGEWHFSRILEGMGIQDVIILPSLETRTATPHPEEEYGTTLRLYNPGTHAWDIAYCFTGKIMRLEARKQDDMIVLTNLANESHKWVFVSIEDNAFHWQNVSVQENGDWRIDVDIYATRVMG